MWDSWSQNNLKLSVYKPAWHSNHSVHKINARVHTYQLFSVQFSSVAQSCLILATPWTAAHQASLTITNSRSLPKLMSIESVMPSTISSSVVPFSSCPQSFPASGSFEISRLFASGGQSIGISASVSVLSVNSHGWFPLGMAGLISLQSKGLSRVFSIHSSKASVLRCSDFFMVQHSHPYMTTGNTIALTRPLWQSNVSAF